MSAAGPGRAAGWSAWRVVVVFGLVSLTADMVYEGMRSIAGPYLGSLGASALTVGLVTGAGEAAALVLRLLAGSLADRTQRHWRLTAVGYAATAVCVPLLALAPALGAAGLAVACVLIIGERVGKAVRSPSKSVLLADAARDVGRGSGFAVHKALDQVGAFAGPLLVAGVILLSGGAVGPALAVLAVPGVVSLVLLHRVWRRWGAEPAAEQGSDPVPIPGGAQAVGDGLAPAQGGLPHRFYALATATALGTAGLMTYGVISFHLVSAHIVTVALVPVVYAGAMAVAAAAALLSGRLYDRVGGRVLLALPLLVALVPALTLSDTRGWVLLGMVLWGAAGGVQDSTVKALVADLVPRARLGTAYGVFAAFQGTAALGGGVLAGALYPDHRGALAVGVAALQALALVLLIRTLRGRPR